MLPLKTYRQFSANSIAAIAARSGLHRRTIERLENGVQAPRKANLVKYLTACGVPNPDETARDILLMGTLEIKHPWILARLHEAIAKKASDVHLQWGSQGALVTIRNHLYELESQVAIPAFPGEPPIIKRPIAGRFDLDEIAVRWCASPTIDGKAHITFRLLSHTCPQARVPEHVHTLVYGALKKEGVILISGSTGSGRTSTLYSLLKAASARGEQIISLEDPHESLMPGVLQIDFCAPGWEKRFAQALRIRPTIVAIDELRDFSKLEAVDSLVGHGIRVIVVLHASTPIDAVNHLVHFRTERPSFSSPITLSLGVRLKSNSDRTGRDLLVETYEPQEGSVE